MADEQKSDFDVKRSTNEANLKQALGFDNLSAEELRTLAQAAEQAERYEDMVVFMKILIHKRLAEEFPSGDRKDICTQDERNLFSVAYKNVVGSRRSSWRSLSEPIGDDQTEDQQKLIDSYKLTVAGEIKTCCLEIQGLLEKLLEAEGKALESDDIQKDEEKKKELTNSWIFYSKMIGDYFRYLREVFPENDSYQQACKKNYAAAMEKAKKNLDPTNPTRLGLALNYSVAHFEIFKDKDAACELAKSAFDQAIEKLDSLNDASYKDSTLIMQLLRDNLTIWSKEDEPEAQ